MTVHNALIISQSAHLNYLYEVWCKACGYRTEHRYIFDATNDRDTHNQTQEQA